MALEFREVDMAAIYKADTREKRAAWEKLQRPAEGSLQCLVEYLHTQV
jgi:hypothetical protein